MKTKLKLKNTNGLILLVLITIGVIGFAYYYFNVIEGAENVKPQQKPNNNQSQQKPNNNQSQQQQSNNRPPNGTNHRKFGNYANSCEDIKYNNGKLTAKCRDIHNKYKETEIMLTKNDIGNISNCNGNLTRLKKNDKCPTVSTTTPANTTTSGNTISS
jgi:hypothetical protein